METDKTNGIPSGFGSLDRITGGFRPGELTIIGARPSVGKSAFLRNIVRNLSVDGGKLNMENPLPVAYFTPVQTSFQLSMRLILEYMEREPHAEEFVKMRWLDKLPLHIDDTPNITAQDFRSRAVAFVKKKGVRLIAVDYLQRMRGPKGSRKSHKAETSATVRCLKETAAELNVPVIALSSLVRNNNGYFSRPRTGDLKYAPEAIEENADVVCLMWKASFESETVVSVVKNRNGQTGDVRFDYNPEEGFSFREISDE
jgi:replicative DNA helicase